MNNPPFSPVCYLDEWIGLYMGYADPDELIAALNELLEAERAGARVALATRKFAGSEVIVQFISDIERDEVRWCAMLKQEIERLGGSPSEACGAFYDKAMTITVLERRLEFLNRGQAWVVRKLEDLMPRVRGDVLYKRLREMWVNHTANIGFTEAVIARLNGANQ